jgi:hypothetical protein
MVHFPAICVAPGYLAEELLHAEGFEQVEYVKVNVNTSSPTIASGQVDLWADAAPGLVNFFDRSTAAVALGGLHAGCYELFAKPEIRAIRGLKGRSVCVDQLADKGFAPSYSTALEVLRELPYQRWRDANPRTLSAFMRFACTRVE